MRSGRGAAHLETTTTGEGIMFYLLGFVACSLIIIGVTMLSVVFLRGFLNVSATTAPLNFRPRASRDDGVALLVVLLITMMMSASAYAMVIMGMNRAKAARFYEAETICFYAAEAGLAKGRAYHEEFSGEFSGALLDVSLQDNGSHIVITSDASYQGSLCSLSVVLLNVPIVVPMVSSLYLSDASVVSLNGSAFTIEGNNKDGIVTSGSTVEILLMIDDAYYNQITGASASPSIGQDASVDFDATFDALRNIAGSAMGTFDEPTIAIRGETHLTGSIEAYGVLLIDGDLTISGTFDYNGLIMVSGDVKVTGDALILGSLMIRGDIEKIAGSIAIEYDEETLLSAQAHIDTFDATYKQVAWIRS
jgi:cytoskeletal protein CcmA (bactofilin family)